MPVSLSQGMDQSPGFLLLSLSQRAANSRNVQNLLVQEVAALPSEINDDLDKIGDAFGDKFGNGARFSVHTAPNIDRAKFGGSMASNFHGFARLDLEFCSAKSFPRAL